MKLLTDHAFRLLMDAVMCNDPAPDRPTHAILEHYVKIESEARGYDDWSVAYHEYNPDAAPK